MDYIEGIRKALEYIETHLEDELEISEIAGRIGYSVFYFQRIFKILCGMSVGEYIRNRKLALAGSELKKGNTRVIDVAYRFGYDSPESFARAFLRFHGILPSQVKSGIGSPRPFPPLHAELMMKGEHLMKYKVMKKEAFYVLEKVSRHSVADEENRSSIPMFWTECRKDGTVESLLRASADRTYVFGICYGTKDDERTFEYSVAVRCEEDIDVPEGFRKTCIPSRTWVVFDCIGAMPEAIQKLWHAIVCDFFPASEYRPTFEMDIEAYTEGDMNRKEYRSEVWVPIDCR